MNKVMGQMTLSTEEKIRLAKTFNARFGHLNQARRISLLPSAKQTPLEVIQKKGKGPLGS